MSNGKRMVSLFLVTALLFSVLLSVNAEEAPSVIPTEESATPDTGHCEPVTESAPVAIPSGGENGSFDSLR